MLYSIQANKINTQVVGQFETGVHQVVALDVKAKEIKDDRTLLEFTVGNNDCQYNITFWPLKEGDNERKEGTYGLQASNADNTILGINLVLMTADPTLSQRTDFTSWDDKNGDEYDENSIIGYALKNFKVGKLVTPKHDIERIEKEVEELRAVKKDAEADELLATIVRDNSDDVFSLKLATIKKGVAVHNQYIAVLDKNGNANVSANKQFLGRGKLFLTSNEKAKIDLILNAKPTEVDDDLPF